MMAEATTELFASNNEGGKAMIVDTIAILDIAAALSQEGSPNSAKHLQDAVAEIKRLSAILVGVNVGVPEPEKQPDFPEEIRTRTGQVFYRCDDGGYRARPPTSVGANVEVSKAALDMLAERRRQVEAEGWTTEHDDKHNDGVLATAAATYAYAAGADTLPTGEVPVDWPWEPSWWKPGTPRRMLVKAAALILAEIERLDRKPAEADGCSGPEPSDSSRPSYRNDFRYTG